MNKRHKRKRSNLLQQATCVNDRLSVRHNQIQPATGGTVHPVWCAIATAKRNIAPYVSPTLDSGTLALLCMDLGLGGRAIPKK